jgi:ribonuclease P protein component
VSNYRFGSALRLTDKTSIQTVFQKGKKLKSKDLSLFFCPNLLTHPRICISVSKKQVSNAHDRNNIKRIVRESFRLNQNNINPLDMVIVIYKSILLLDRKETRSLIDAQWQKLATSSKSS